MKQATDDKIQNMSHGWWDIDAYKMRIEYKIIKNVINRKKARYGGWDESQFDSCLLIYIILY